MSYDDEPVGEIRKVRSVFWIGDAVLHRCDPAEDGNHRRGLVVAVMFRGSTAGVSYVVQWSIGDTETHDEIELEPAGVTS